MKNNLSLKDYDELRINLLNGEAEKIMKIVHELRNSEKEEERLLRLLLSHHLALKNNELENEIPIREDEAPFITAEIYYMAGLKLYHESCFIRGSLMFEKAASFYKKAGDCNKELLSLFNSYMGKTNEKPCSLKVNERFNKLNELARKAEELSNLKIRGLVHRQKACEFQELGKNHAALEEIKNAVKHLELYGAKSDYDLSLIKAADIAIDLGLKEEAITFLDYIIEPIDARTKFPLDYIKARVSNLWNLNLNEYSIINPYWLEKYNKSLKTNSKISSKKEEQPTLKWDIIKNLLFFSSDHVGIKIKYRSFEGKLLQLLIDNKNTKNILCESLWPGVSLKEHVDNRLHRLISRLNKKNKWLNSV